MNASITFATAGRVLRQTWRRPAIVTWALAIGLVAVGASVLEIWLTPLLMVLGAFLLPVAAVGSEVARAEAPDRVEDAVERYVVGLDERVGREVGVGEQLERPFEAVVVVEERAGDHEARCG